LDRIDGEPMMLCRYEGEPLESTPITAGPEDQGRRRSSQFPPTRDQFQRNATQALALRRFKLLPAGLSSCLVDRSPKIAKQVTTFNWTKVPLVRGRAVKCRHDRPRAPGQDQHDFCEDIEVSTLALGPTLRYAEN
jgi:hypothetical protein